MAAAVHEGMRELQDRFDGWRVAEAIEGKRKHDEFWDDEKEMIRNSASFFIAASRPGAILTPPWFEPIASRIRPAARIQDA